MSASGLYHGVVTHARLRPRLHRLRYRIFMTLLDLDELPRLDASLRLFGHNRPGLISFHDKDHLGRTDTLRAEVDAALARAGVDLQGGPIRLLCMPRVLGFAFNPISVYFCHRRDGSLGATLYEVNNTFGGRHTYLIPVNGPAEGVIAQTCDKALHVSPFMDMAMRYHFKVAAPDEDAYLQVDGHDADGAVIAAVFRGRREALSDRAILMAFAAHPFLSIAVLAAIHWEAVKLLFKGLKLKPGAPPPEQPITRVWS